MRRYHPLLWCLLGLVVLAGGLTVAHCLGVGLGPAGDILLLLAGCLAIPLCIAVFIGTLSLADIARQAGPRYPPCPTAHCSGGNQLSITDPGDYERHTADGETLLRCKCGHELVLRRAGRRALLCLPDGTLQPYMVHREYQGWLPDTGK